MDFGPCRKIVVFSIAFRAVKKFKKSSRGRPRVVVADSAGTAPAFLGGSLLLVYSTDITTGTLTTAKDRYYYSDTFHSHNTGTTCYSHNIDTPNISQILFGNTAISVKILTI